MLSQIGAVARRVLQQLIRDRRFLALSIVVPVVVIYMLFLFFDAVNRPFFDETEFVPAIGAFIVHFLTYVLSAIVLVRERTQQTMMRMFVSGYRHVSVIIGYVAAYSLIATVQSLIVLIALNQLFALEYSITDMLGMYAIIWLLAVISIALGIFVSNFARNEGQVLPMVPLVLMPSVFFSGIIVSVDILPDWVSVLSYTTPMFYANNAIDAIGADFSVIALGGLILYGVVVMGLAVLTLREQV